MALTNRRNCCWLNETTAENFVKLDNGQKWQQITLKNANTTFSELTARAKCFSASRSDGAY